MHFDQSPAHNKIPRCFSAQAKFAGHLLAIDNDFVKHGGRNIN
jgi:hypothetical protein